MGPKQTKYGILNLIVRNLTTGVKKKKTVFQVAFAHLKLIRTAFTIKQYRSSAEPNTFLNLTVNYISKDNQDTFSTVAKLSMKHYGVFP